MPNLKAYDKDGNIVAKGFNIVGDVGSVIITNLIPNTLYPQGEFFLSWETSSYETEKVEVPEFTTLESTYREITFYFHDYLLVEAKSAYDIAVGTGFIGTQEEWVATIKGEPGKDLVMSDLTEEQRRDLQTHLKGDKGDAFTFNDFTEEQLNSLKGKDGRSAYELAVDKGFQGTEEEYLESLKGEPGTSLTFLDLTEDQKKELAGSKLETSDTRWILMSLQNGFFNPEGVATGLSYRLVTIGDIKQVSISGKIKTPTTLPRGKKYIGNIPISNPRPQAVTAYASNYSINGTNDPIFSVFYENNVLSITVINDVPANTVFDIGATITI